MAESIWFYKGTIEPSLNGWKFFENPSVNGSFIRVSFDLTAQTIGSVFTRLLLRRHWATTPSMHDKAILVYPSVESTVIHTPLNQYYEEAGLVVYDWQAKLVLRRRFRNWRTAEEPLYKVTLEEI